MTKLSDEIKTELRLNGLAHDLASRLGRSLQHVHMGVAPKPPTSGDHGAQPVQERDD